MTSANLHDIRLGEAMILGDEKGFFADKAYDSHGTVSLTNMEWAAG